MKNTPERKSEYKNESTWSSHIQTEDYPALSESLETDVCIIGGGLTGLLSAYLLSKSGKRVIILEKKEIGSGASGLTTAFLTSSIDTNFSDLIRTLDLVHAKSVIASHEAAIILIEKISRDESIECDFKRCSNYLYATKEKDFSILDEEHDAARTLGLNAHLEKDGSKLGFKNFGYLEIKNQAKFNPVKFMEKLAEKLSQAGVRIFEHTEATEILPRDFGSSVRAREHSVQAKWVISATYSPFLEPARLYLKKGMYKTYVLEAYTQWKIPEGTYEDTENPYHYMRIDNEVTGYRIIIGGEDHREDIKVDEARNFNSLETYLRNLIPAESYTVRRIWTGPILEPIDGLAFIGRKKSKENIIYAFAFSGNGMTYAGIAAMIIRDTVLGNENQWDELYKTDRVAHFKALMTKGKDYAGELVKGALKNVATSSKKLKSKLPRRKKV
jgi:glycine/D-amino acid oxidase-like deaminating enzyme